MSKIFTEYAFGPEQYFLMDSNGDLYRVSKELAESHSNKAAVAVVDHVDMDTNTIYFTSPRAANG